MVWVYASKDAWAAQKLRVDHEGPPFGRGAPRGPSSVAGGGWIQGETQQRRDLKGIPSGGGGGFFLSSPSSLHVPDLVSSCCCSCCCRRWYLLLLLLLLLLLVMPCSRMGPIRRWRQERHFDAAFAAAVPAPIAAAAAGIP